MAHLRNKKRMANTTHAHSSPNSLSRLIRHLTPLPIRPRNARAPGQGHAHGLGERVHGEGSPHGGTMTHRRGARGNHVYVLVVGDVAGGKLFAAVGEVSWVKGLGSEVLGLRS